MNLSTKDIQMKNTLGKILLIILLEVFAIANSYLANYSLTANKTNVHVKEAIEITLKAQQTDTTDVMFFFLEPKASHDYKIELLQKVENEISYHNKQTTFTYLLFPLVKGEIKVDFNFTIKVASDEAVAQVYRGSRDNVKWIETKNTDIILSPIILNVQRLEYGTKLIGDFELISKIDNKNINAYESSNITYTLIGNGYDKIDINPITNIGNVNIFRDITKHFSKATKDGYKIKREFNYALLSDKTFDVDSKEIKCFSPKKNIYYTLKTDSYKINVTKTDISTIIDKEDYPQQIHDFSILINLLVYLIVFLTGFISAKLLPKDILKRFYKKDDNLIDIKKSKNPKALLLTLLKNYSNEDLEDVYKELEKLMYKKAGYKSFKSIKEALIESLKKIQI